MLSKSFILYWSNLFACSSYLINQKKCFFILILYLLHGKKYCTKKSFTIRIYSIWNFPVYSEKLASAIYCEMMMTILKNCKEKNQTKNQCILWQNASILLIVLENAYKNENIYCYCRRRLIMMMICMTNQFEFTSRMFCGFFITVFICCWVERKNIKPRK